MTWATRTLRLDRRWVALVMVLLLTTTPLGMITPTQAQGGGTHTVQAGENLFRIALQYGYSVEYLASVNGITDPTRIFVGQVLSIPDPSTASQPAPAPQPDVAPAAQPAPANTATVHTVQRGETLASIGRIYGVGWVEIAQANQLADPSRIYAGQQLTIPVPGSAPAPANEPAPAPAAPAAAPAATTGQRTHIVQAGEHLASIARAYDVSWPAIAAMNNISDPNHIYAGQVLNIPAPGTYVEPQATTWTPPAAPSPTITVGKQIVVDLSDQRVYAFENGNLVRNVLVSTGLWGTPTVTGDYRVYLKYDSQLMSGPGYYLPGVPWVMYFYQGYSLHGTYWHNNFGQPMSHGCVNMPTPEAEWFYRWAPIGTPVHVQP